MRRRPFEFQHEHRLVAHSSRATKYGLGRRIERFDNAEADRMKAVRRDALEVFDQERAQPLHLGKALPAERFEPSQQKVADTLRGLVGPEAIQLLAQDIG